MGCFDLGLCYLVVVDAFVCFVGVFLIWCSGCLFGCLVCDLFAVLLPAS